MTLRRLSSLVMRTVCCTARPRLLWGTRADDATPDRLDPGHRVHRWAARSGRDRGSVHSLRGLCSRICIAAPTVAVGAANDTRTWPHLRIAEPGGGRRNCARGLRQRVRWFLVELDRVAIDPGAIDLEAWASA